MGTVAPSNAALLIIDVQQAFDDPVWGIRNNPEAENNIARLIAAWRNQKGYVIHVRHSSMEPDSTLRAERPGFEYKPEATPTEGEVTFTKNVNSAFIGTDLEPHLRDNGIENLVIVGLTTDHCVSTTTRMAGNLGFNVTLVSDGTATFDRKGPDGAYYSAVEIHNIHLASLNDEFCVIRSTGEILDTIKK